jgi:hypothetical protein
MSRAIWARVENTQQRLGGRSHETTSPNEMNGVRKEVGLSDWEPVHEQKFRIMQPLFRAVAIAIKQDDYSIAVPDIAQIPVLLIITGVEEGLSAPITFDSIADKISAHHKTKDSLQAAETNLATAVSFVMGLEKRELAAFGPRPDPAETCKDPSRSCLLGRGEALFLAQQRGWEGDEAPEGPSSTWVDFNIYREWTGEGAEWDGRVAQGWERTCRKRVLNLEPRDDQNC